MPRAKDPEDLLPLTPSVFHILVALADGERHGYAIMRQVVDDTHGALRLRGLDDGSCDNDHGPLRGRAPLAVLYFRYDRTILIRSAAAARSSDVAREPRNT